MQNILKNKLESAFKFKCAIVNGSMSPEERYEQAYTLFGDNDGYKVLLINFIPDNESIWGFPKGHVENNETEIQTAVREIKEEVGLNVDIIPKFRVSTRFSMKKGTINEAVYYCAEAKSLESICQKGEVEKTEWFNFEEAYNHLTYECDKKVLMKFVEFFREHIG